MRITLTEIVSSSFRSFTEKYGFCQQNEVSDGDTYSIDYASKLFVVRLERYRAEFNATLYKPGNSDEQVNLFNLLAYLAHPRQDAPVSEYFYNEANIEERYRKQLAHIAAVLDACFSEISDFFRSGDYTSNIGRVREFMVKKYPELFKRRSK